MLTQPQAHVAQDGLDDPQLQLELRAFAELLLDIYEYRLQTNSRRNHEDPNAQLDGARPDLTMEERSSPEQNTTK